MESTGNDNSVSEYESPEHEHRPHSTAGSRNRRQTGTLTSNTFTNSGHDMRFDLFIGSEAGKLVYFYSKSIQDDSAASLVAVIQGMVNFYTDANQDELKCITTLGGLRVTFCIKSPLIIVLVTEKLYPFDPSLIINQVFASVVSILTFKTLKNVFMERQSFDLRSKIVGSEKVIDTLIEEGFHKNPLTISNKVIRSKSAPSVPFDVLGYLTSMPNNILSSGLASLNVNNQIGRSVSRTTNRLLIPVMPLSPSHRDALGSALSSAISSTPSSIAFAILLHLKTERSITPSESTCDTSGSSGLSQIHPNTQLDLDSCELMTIHCAMKAKLNPLDVQLILSVITSSQCQLASAESLWLPICIPRLDSDAFAHSHVSLLQMPIDLSPTLSASSHSAASSRDQICSIFIVYDKDDFDKCQKIKVNFTEKLIKLKLTRALFPDLNAPFLQSMIYYSTSKPTAMIYRNSSLVPYTNFKKLLNYLPQRMASLPNYKIFWLHSDDERVTLLGWSSSTFTVYFQFNATVSYSEALTTASNALKWIKKEEEKYKLKDYQ